MIKFTYYCVYIKWKNEQLTKTKKKKMTKKKNQEKTQQIKKNPKTLFNFLW